MTDAIVFERLVAEDVNWGTGTVTVTHPAGGVQPGTQVSISALGVDGADGRAVTIVCSPGTITAGSSTTFNTNSYDSVSNPTGLQNTTVQGAIDISCDKGDMMLYALSAASGTPTLDGLMIFPSVATTNEASITFFNPTDVDITIADSSTLYLLALRPRT